MKNRKKKMKDDSHEVLVYQIDTEIVPKPKCLIEH